MKQEKISYLTLRISMDETSEFWDVRLKGAVQQHFIFAEKLPLLKAEELQQAFDEVHSDCFIKAT